MSNFKFNPKDFEFHPDVECGQDLTSAEASRFANAKLKAWLAAAPIVFGDIDIEHGKPYYSFETIDLGVEGYKAKLVQFKKTKEIRRR